jgi:malate dehydrogenase (oxaloacetate-decarboxylating)
MMNFDQESMKVHEKLKGKIGVIAKSKLKSRKDLSILYTPGVGAVSSFIANNPDQASRYTWLNNNLAVISDGSAVLGLGNIGPKASLPVMEGKCLLFKQLANIDAVPIVLDVHDIDKIVDTIVAISPGFGAINLEDIASPNCFEIERQLKNRLSIPIMHDDQHGTAVVVLAGLINAAKVKGKSLTDSRIVIVGSGSAGIAVSKLIYMYSGAQITVVDSKGIIHSGRTDLNKYKLELSKFNKIKYTSFTLRDALKDADIFIGLSTGNLLAEDDIKLMGEKPIVFTLANPTPEIDPDLAKKAGALVVATGRSDYPNQVNNVLAFPGIFRGAIDHKVTQITDDHKIHAAEALANLVKRPSDKMIIPEVLDKRVVPAIANVII